MDNLKILIVGILVGNIEKWGVRRKVKEKKKINLWKDLIGVKIYGS